MSRPPRLATVATVARYTLIEQASRRHLWWIAGIALGLACGLAVMGRFVALPGYTTRETVELFASAPAFYLVLIDLIVLGMGLMRSDIDSGVAALFLSRPVSAAEYVVGRYLGHAAVLVAAVMILGVGSFAVVAASGTTDWRLLYSFIVLAYNAALFLAIIALLGLVVGTVPSIAVGGVAFYALGQGSTYLLWGLAGTGTLSAGVAFAARAFTVLAPHVLASPLSAGKEAAFNDVGFVVPGPTLPDLLWSLAWLAGSLWLAVLALRRREL